MRGHLTAPLGSGGTRVRRAAITLFVCLVMAMTVAPAPGEAKATARRTPTTSRAADTPQKAPGMQRSQGRGPTPRHGRVARGHGRRHGARGAVRVARRPIDPRKLALPELAEGDGSPVLDVAARFLGRPYRFGAAGVGGAFDCSGFVREVFSRFGIELPHSAREQYAYGDRIDRDELEAGDLVFFRTRRGGVSHVGIYVGEDKFIHANSRGGAVQVDSLSDGYYAARFLGARRLDV